MPDGATSTPHSWQEFFWLCLVGLLGFGSSYLPSLFRRRQTNAEIENTQSGTRKTDAETRSLELQTNLQAGDIVLTMIREVAVTTLKVERLQAERDHWERKANAESAARELLEQQLDPIISLGKRMEETEQK